MQCFTSGFALAWKRTNCCVSRVAVQGVHGGAIQYFALRFGVRATVAIVRFHCLSRCLFRSPVGRVSTSCGRQYLMGRGFQRPSPPLSPKQPFGRWDIGPVMIDTFKWEMRIVILAYGRSALRVVTVAWVPPFCVQYPVRRSWCYGSGAVGYGVYCCVALLLSLLRALFAAKFSPSHFPW